jgi:hypothetical protein
MMRRNAADANHGEGGLVQGEHAQGLARFATDLHPLAAVPLMGSPYFRYMGTPGDGGRQANPTAAESARVGASL